MFLKTNTVIFDVLVMALVVSVAFGTWTISRALALVVPLSDSSSGSIQFDTSVSLSEALSPEVLRQEQIEQFKAQLSAVVTEFAQNEPNEYGIVVKHLGTGETIGTSATSTFISASLYKPFAAVMALKLVDQGKLSLDTPLSLAGRRSVRQCVIDTISVSDNPCGHALISISGADTPSGLAQLRADGYGQTDLGSLYPVTTAQDVARLFEHIYVGDLLSPASNQLLLDALKDQRVNNRLPKGLNGASIAHKTGDLEGAAHDAGIVYSNQTGDYIIAVLSGPDDNGRNLLGRYERFGDIMESVHQLMLRYGPVLTGAEPSV